MRRLEEATVPDRAGPGRVVQRAVNSYADLVRAAPIGVMPSIPASAIGDLEEAIRLVSAIAPKGTRYIWESSVVDEFFAILQLRLRWRAPSSCTRATARAISTRELTSH